MGDLLEVSCKVGLDSFRHKGIADRAFTEEHLIPNAGPEIFPGIARVMPVHAQLRRAADFGFHPAPTDMQGVGLNGKRRVFCRRENEFVIRLESPFRIRVSEMECVAYRE